MSSPATRSVCLHAPLLPSGYTVGLFARTALAFRLHGRFVCTHRPCLPATRSVCLHAPLLPSGYTVGLFETKTSGTNLSEVIEEPTGTQRPTIRTNGYPKFKVKYSYNSVFRPVFTRYPCQDNGVMEMEYIMEMRWISKKENHRARSIMFKQNIRVTSMQRPVHCLPSWGGGRSNHPERHQVI